MKRYPTMIALAMLFAASAAAQEGDATNLAKAAQNPIADMISVPLQYNINFDTGPLGGTQHLVNIQPVYPVKLNADWNVITRTIVPVISQPAFARRSGSRVRPRRHPVLGLPLAESSRWAVGSWAWARLRNWIPRPTTGSGKGPGASDPPPSR